MFYSVLKMFVFMKI